MTAEELSTTMPLVPPVTFVAAAVFVGPGVVMLKDMTHPNVGKLNGQFMGKFVSGLPVTLKKIRSVAVVLL